MQDFRPHTAQLPYPPDPHHRKCGIWLHHMWLWAISAQMVGLAAVLAASSARCSKIRLHHPTCLSTVKLDFHPAFSKSRMLDMLWVTLGMFPCSVVISD